MMQPQIYEEYWKLTLEYTDIHSDKFKGTLDIIIKCIDNKCSYEEMQIEVNKKYPKKDMASVRKSINQFVKLGFVENIEAYCSEALDFLHAKTKRKRNSLFSKIVYKYAKFNASITKPHDWNQINFLIKTLEEVGRLKKENIIGLMLVDIPSIEAGYLTQEEVEKYTRIAKNSGFVKRKYNQIGYLTNLLNKLDDVVFVQDVLYFEEDAKVIFGESLQVADTKKRDQYLHRVYKNLLKEEVEDKYETPKCMVEKLAYPSLVASHIKPFIQSDDIEAYDPNNGLLLSRNFDILFDQGYITFEDDGCIRCSNELDQEVSRYISEYRLDKNFINNMRLGYLGYHRENVFRK